MRNFNEKTITDAVIQRFATLPLTTKLVDALVMACSLALAILWQGELRPDGEGAYHLELADGGGSWPLITLEPALHQWLANQERGRPVALIGCANPWGPWLRVSRLAR